MTDKAPTAGVEAARGQPYYEKLKRDIRQTLANKRRIDTQVVSDWRISSHPNTH